MFIGHYAVGFAAKKFAPKTSLGLLIAAPIFLDLIWPVFLLLGWEHVRIEPPSKYDGPGNRRTLNLVFCPLGLVVRSTSRTTRKGYSQVIDSLFEKGKVISLRPDRITHP
jgi:hypothetical protein